MYRLCELVELTKINNIKSLENICCRYIFAEECDTSKNYLVCIEYNTLLIQLALKLFNYWIFYLIWNFLISRIIYLHLCSVGIQSLLK